MRTVAALVTGTAMVLLAFSSAAQDADDLEVTMEVLDDVADLEGDIGSRRVRDDELVPDDDAEARDAALNAAAEEALVKKFAGIEDDFEHDDVNDDFDADIHDDDDFDADDKIDLDRIDEDGV